MPTPDTQLSAEQSRQVAETIREEIARRRISRQTLAAQAKLSLSTLEKVLGGRRPFTLATTVRLEQALGVPLRKALEVAPATSPPTASALIRAAQ
jgi:transcriptional regulator with XRE-family HTH domain